jgi:predicted RecB family nuclease
MATKITREIIESFLDCRYKGYLKLAGVYGSPSAYEQLMRESRARIRLAATAKLQAQHEEGQALQRLILTLGVLKRGEQFLLEATVENEEFCLCFDALQRATGSSRLGDFYYVPVLFHEAERPVRKLNTQLELLGQILGSIQGRQPDWGILIYGRNCELKKVKLRPNGQQAKRVMEAIKELWERKTPRLMLNSHCTVCEFRHRCHTEAMAKDDLSLLRSVREKDIERYERKGIFTVTQLSYTFRLRKKGKRQRQQKQPHYPALKALAIRDKKIYVLGTADLPVCPVRIYFDIEGAPDRRFDYLLGLIIETNGTEERFSFWADTPKRNSESSSSSSMSSAVTRTAGCMPTATMRQYSCAEWSGS